MENLPIEQDKDEIIIKCSLEEMAKAFFKDYEIIWHDPHVNSEENQQYMIQLEELCKVKTFTEWRQAEDYIKAAKTICHVITSGTNGELLVKEIFSRQNVPKILTFCRDEDFHSAWVKNYHQKVLCAKTKIEDVISEIRKNLLEWQKQTSSLKFDLPAFAPVFNDSDKSEMNHLHYYLKVIPNFHNRVQAKKDFVDLSKRVFSDRKNEKFIADFEQKYDHYKMEDTLRWYTQPSFLFKVINNCLRIATSDSIQWSRFFLKDLERAIKDQYHQKSKDFSGLLYRAAYLSKEEWSNLKANVNCEIEMHGFLSVSKDKSAALKFMGVDPAQKVFITIIIPKGPIEEEQGFAEVEEFSKFPKEQEFLFNVRSRFTVLETEDEYSKEFPSRHLVLLYGAQGLRQYIAEKNPVQQVSIEDIESVLCSRCKVPASERGEKLFFMSLEDLEKRIYSCQNCLDDNNDAPFLCIPVQEKISSIKIKGHRLAKINQPRIPLYGYKCSKCGVKNQESYFVCTDCGEKWCQNCFGKTQDCIEVGHSVIFENYPFSFWCEKMSEKEFSYVKFQNDLVTKSNHEFQQVQMYFDTHEYGKAIEFMNLYLEQNEAKGKDPRLTMPYNNIGVVYESIGEYEKALEYHLKAVDLFKSIHGENNSEAAISYVNIGWTYQNRGEYNKALEYHLKALAIHKLIHGENHPSVGTSYNYIGVVYERQGEYDKALGYHLKALHIREFILGKNHPDVAASYNNIGLVYEHCGEYKKALEYHLKAVDLLKLIHGENHPSVASSYNNIGVVYDSQRESKKALEYHLRALKIEEFILGKYHPDVATSYGNIGLAYESLKEYEKALVYHQKALNIKVSKCGENHPDVATAYSNIGSTHYGQGDYQKALEYFLRALEIEKLYLEENHPDVATSYGNIGLAYESLKEYEKALEYNLKALNIKESQFGENHPEVAMIYSNLGLTYYGQGDYQKALEYFLKALKIEESYLEENNHSLVNPYGNIARAYEKLAEYKNSLEYYLKSFNISKIAFRENHPTTINLHKKISQLESMIQKREI